MTLKVAFVDFWPNFYPYGSDETLGKWLRSHFDFIVDDANPDIVFFSVFGNRHETYPNAIKVLYAAENFRSNYYYINSKANLMNDDELFKVCDYAITNYFIEDDRHTRLSACMRKYGFDFFKDIKQQNVDGKKNFCLFVASNGSQGQTEVRDEFFYQLSKYCLVHSLGSHLNNHKEGRTAPFDPIEYRNLISKYKFMICFENTNHPGYTSEKLIKAYEAGVVPIYWGNDKIGIDFNLNSMIHFNSLIDSMQSVLSRVKTMNEDWDWYEKTISEKPLTQSNLIELNKREQDLLNLMTRIFDHANKRNKI